VAPCRRVRATRARPRGRVSAQGAATARARGRSRGACHTPGRYRCERRSGDRSDSERRGVRSECRQDVGGGSAGGGRGVHGGHGSKRRAHRAMECGARDSRAPRGAGSTSKGGIASLLKRREPAESPTDGGSRDSHPSEEHEHGRFETGHRTVSRSRERGARVLVRRRSRLRSRRRRHRDVRRDAQAPLRARQRPRRQNWATRRPRAPASAARSGAPSAPSPPRSPRSARASCCRASGS
jgi:hypothetical protein